MTALAADRKTVRQDRDFIKEPMIASDIIYLGGMCFRNTSGYISPVPTAGFKFAGVAAEQQDNSSGSAGDLEVDLFKDGIHHMVGSSLAQADVGKPLYASDDQTVTLTPGGVYVGNLAYFKSATVAPVDILPGIMAAGGADVFLLSVFWGSTVGTAAVSAMQDFEMPRRWMVLRGYASARVAPSSTYNCDIHLTDGSTSSTVSIATTATKGEAEALNNIYEADTDVDILLVDDNASATTEDVQVTFVCVAL